MTVAREHATEDTRHPAQPTATADGAVRHTVAATPPAPARVHRASDPRLLQRLQGAAGNRAVSRLVAQRYTAPVKPPPAQSPGFRRVQSDVAAKKQKVAQHPPAAAESKAAQDAAVAPPDDKEAQGKAANAEKMHAAKPGEFNKAAFIAAVNEAIAKQAPKNLDEADKFSDSGKAEKVKEEVDGKVSDGKKTSAKDIETTTKAPPDTSAAKEKQVTPLTPDRPPPNPGAPSAADAIPAKQPAAVTDFSEGPAANDKAMADADVTEDQLKKGNEPSFDEALSEKKKAEQHSAKAPGEARAAEDAQLAEAKAGAAASGAQAMASLTATRAAAGKQVDGGKGETKSKDEEKRQQVTARLQKVFDATKKDVETTLSGLDKKVDEQFTAGEKTARDAFTADHEKRMKAYKDKRYSGLRGKAKWLKDKLLGMPAEANQIFQESRKLYVTKMQGVISSIADTIGTELGKAKSRIAEGRADLKAEVDKLPADLKKFGQEAAQDFQAKFEDLETQVNDKSQQLVTDLAQKYTQALGAVDEEIKKLQEANKGLVQKAVDAVAGVIKTIIELKNMLMGVLAKAVSAIGKIIKDPIGFLGNLVRAVGAGLNQFISNIGDHLKKGLVAWLLGTATKAGIEIPAKFDLKGIIQLLASMLGLTWANIRARVTRKGVPDQAMGAVESSVPVASALMKEGPAGAAKEIEQSVGDLKSTILEQLKSYLIPTVIIAGITWILSLLNPASAFIRAVKAIIDIVTFVVTQGAQIIEFVNAILDAVIAIAGGGAAGVPKMVESALAASIPVLLGVLASLLGIGSLAGKVRQVFQAAARPVNRAIDKIVDFIAKQGKKLWAKLSSKEKKGRGPHSSAETKRSRDVKKEARDMLAGPTARPMETQQELDSLISQVLRRLRPRGLKALYTKPSRKDPQSMQIIAKASPPSGVGRATVLDLVKTIPIHLPDHGKALAAELKAHWWDRQLKDANAWADVSALENFETEAINHLKQPSTQKQLAGYFDPTLNGNVTRDKKGAATAAFRKHALHQLNPSPPHATRVEFYKKAGDGAEQKLKENAKNEVRNDPQLNQKLSSLKFEIDDQYGRFSSLPVPKREVDPKLKAAAGGRIIEFLKDMAEAQVSKGLTLKELKDLWTEEGPGENPHKKWLKGEFRAVADGHHEWIPTNQMMKILEIDMTQSTPRNSFGWIDLQNKLRSITTDVVWEIRPLAGASEVGSHDMDAHVGAFSTYDGNPIFNGRDKKWHDSLREYFTKFITTNSNGTPAQFLAHLLDLLEAGKLMWDGKTSDFTEQQRALPIKAVYKSIHIDSDRVGEGPQRTKPFTVDELGAAQEQAYNRVRDTFLSILESLSS